MISGRPIYIAKADISPIFCIFQISASADKFFCLANAFEADFYFDDADVHILCMHTALTFSLLFAIDVNSSV